MKKVFYIIFAALLALVICSVNNYLENTTPGTQAALILSIMIYFSVGLYGIIYFLAKEQKNK